MQLADTSAWVWTRTVGGELRSVFDDAVISGEIATCEMVQLELLYSARNAGEFVTLRSELDTLPNCPIGTEQWQRALHVYTRLAHEGGLHHRAVLHYDEDYDRIAAITGQQVRWLATRGSLGPTSHRPGR